MAKRATRLTEPRQSVVIRPVIVRSLEPIDLEAFLDRYARAIVEAKGLGPSSGPCTPNASTEAA
jgi:hypothetical protein